MRTDSGNAHFGLATGPLASPAVDFTSGCTAWRRASRALGPEVALAPAFFGSFNFRLVGILRFGAKGTDTKSRSQPDLYPLALNKSPPPPPRWSEAWPESRR